MKTMGEGEGKGKGKNGSSYNIITSLYKKVSTKCQTGFPVTDPNSPNLHHFQRLHIASVLQIYLICECLSPYQQGIPLFTFYNFGPTSRNMLLGNYWDYPEHGHFTIKICMSFAGILTLPLVIHLRWGKHGDELRWFLHLKSGFSFTVIFEFINSSLIGDAEFLCHHKFLHISLTKSDPILWFYVCAFPESLSQVLMSTTLIKQSKHKKWIQNWLI